MRTARFITGTESERATVTPAPLAGDKFFATDTRKVYQHNGTAWVEITMTWVASQTVEITGVKVSTIENGT